MSIESIQETGGLETTNFADCARLQLPELLRQDPSTREAVEAGTLLDTSGEVARFACAVAACESNVPLAAEGSMLQRDNACAFIKSLATKDSLQS